MRKALRLAFCAALLGLPQDISGQAAPSDPELNSGLRQVDEGDFRAAIRTLGAVVQRLRERGGPSGDLSLGYLYLGIAHLSLGEEPNARAAFISAQETDRVLKLSPSEFPPRVIEAFEQARRESAAKQGAQPRPRVASPVFFEAARQGDFVTVQQFLKDDPDLVGSSDEKFGASALHWAALKGHQAIVGLLLAQGADVTLRNNDGETPLQVAERAKQEEVARLLRATGGPAAPSGGGSIFEAAKAGDVEGVRKLLAQSPALLNQGDVAFGATPLHWAALRGQADVTKLLLAQGADVNVRNKDGETPLQVAERAKRSAVAQLLKGAAAPISGFVDAVRDGNLPRVKQLFAENRGLLNQKDAQFGATPLHWAALKGHADVVEYLLAQGADSQATNNNGETPLTVAERAKRNSVLPLLQSGHATAAAGGGAVIEAAKRGDLAALRRLVTSNPRLIDEKDAQFGATALHWAALRGHAEVVEFLLTQGADVRAKNGAGETPLQVAQRAGRTDVVRILSKPGS